MVICLVEITEPMTHQKPDSTSESDDKQGNWVTDPVTGHHVYRPNIVSPSSRFDNWLSAALTVGTAILILCVTIFLLVMIPQMSGLEVGGMVVLIAMLMWYFGQRLLPRK